MFRCITLHHHSHSDVYTSISSSYPFAELLQYYIDAQNLIDGRGSNPNDRLPTPTELAWAVGISIALILIFVYVMWDHLFPSSSSATANTNNSSTNDAPQGDTTANNAFTQAAAVRQQQLGM